jgi:hypothetical protein
MDAILAYLDQECVAFDLSVLTSVVFSRVGAILAYLDQESMVFVMVDAI